MTSIDARREMINLVYSKQSACAQWETVMGDLLQSKQLTHSVLIFRV